MNTVTIPLEEYNWLKECQKNEGRITVYNKDIVCPYCGFKNNYRSLIVPLGENHTFLYCSDEDGGCGEKFVMNSHIKVLFKYKSHKLKKSFPFFGKSQK